MGHARALLGFDDAAAMERAARTVVARGCRCARPRRCVEGGAPAGAAPRQPAAPPAKSASVRDLEERLTRALGGPVEIREDAPGKAGTIEIRYLDLDHLDRLLDRLL